MPVSFGFLLYYIAVHVFDFNLLENTGLNMTVAFWGDFPHLNICYLGGAEVFLLTVMPTYIQAWRANNHKLLLC